MRAALAFALRRTSARVILGVGLGGLAYAVYGAVGSFHPHPAWLRFTCSQYEFPVSCSGLESSPWDLGVAAAVAVVAIIAAAAIYRRISARSVQAG